jgi:MoaA/NifB/PqqE/SkfB family radical SAM enzyme
MTILNEYNQYRYDFSNYPKEGIVSKFPLHIDIELTNRCNLQCKPCPFHGTNALFRQDPCDMDFKLYKKIIDEGSKKGLKAVKLNFGGEPLLYKYLIKAIKYAKKSGIIDVQINSNGLLLSSKMIDALIDSGLDLIIVTDYGNPLQVKNLTELQTKKQWKGFQTPPKLIVKAENSEWWKYIADKVEIIKYYDYDNLNENFTKSDFKCEQPWQRFLVLADGTVCSCSCGIVMVDKILGNAWNFDLEDLWNSNQMKFMRICHANSDTHLLRDCRLCPARNEWIEDQNL